jgi:chromosome segregation ATPase
MDKLLDPSFWETSWKTFWSAPGVAIPLLLVWAAVVWWFRGLLKDREISGLKGQIDTLEQRRLLAVEQRAAVEEKKTELFEKVDALEQQITSLQRQIDQVLRPIGHDGKPLRHMDRLPSDWEVLSTPKEFAEEWLKKLATSVSSVDAIKQSITELSSANDQLDRTLSRTGLVPLNQEERDALRAIMRRKASS